MQCHNPKCASIFEVPYWKIKQGKGKYCSKKGILMAKEKTLGISLMLIGLILCMTPGIWSMFTDTGFTLMGFGYCIFNLVRLYNKLIKE